MKTILLFLASFCISVMLQAQVSKNINVTTAGSLSSLLTQNELTTITDLTLTGTIDARDFRTMSGMPQLAALDISQVTVKLYTGYGGTKISLSWWGQGISTEYPANSIPIDAFRTKIALSSVLLPQSLTSIGDEAFKDCTTLTSVTIPPGVTIGNWAFSGCTGLTSITIPQGITRI